MANSPAITDFVNKQNAFNDRLDKAVDGIGGDIKALNDIISKLQESQGQITAEDQALLDQAQARSEAAVSKFEALDALTPPVAPAPNA